MYGLMSRSNDELRTGLPQSVVDLNSPLPPVSHNNISVSTPATPASAHAQYPPLQPPKTPQPAPHTHSLGRKFSLQQLPMNSSSFEDKRVSTVLPLVVYLFSVYPIASLLCVVVLYCELSCVVS